VNAAVAVEALKLRRSRLWWITMLAFSVAVAMGVLFAYISQDPQRARALGLLGTKAQLTTVDPDWSGYLVLLGQIASIGGALIVGMAMIWMFGREFAEHTVKDLLALPTSRTAIVGAKFVVIAGWSAVLHGYLWGLGLIGGAVLGLPGWSIALAAEALLRLMVIGAMTTGLAATLALAASVGRGYLGGIGTLFVTVFCAQIVAALGYGASFPWSVPALYAGVAGPDAGSVGAFGVFSVVIVSAGAIAATIGWWRRADQTT
jgi:ABC-2 type transport system permease protein